MSAYPSFRVYYDAADDCWRIWQRIGSPYNNAYTCLLWLRFATEQAGRAYLAKHEIPPYQPKRTGLSRNSPLFAKTELAKTELERRTPLRRVPPRHPNRPIGHASAEQKARVNGLACLVCAQHAGSCTPAHVVPRGHPKVSVEAADDPRAVVPLCVTCHRQFDDGRIDLLPYLEPAWRDSQEWAAGAVGLATAMRTITGEAHA